MFQNLKEAWRAIPKLFHICTESTYREWLQQMENNATNMSWSDFKFSKVIEKLLMREGVAEKEKP